jgi:hypothetical protein
MVVRALGVASLLLVLAACVPSDGFVPGGPTASYQKPGTTRQQRRDEILQCQVAALQTVPQAASTRYSPGFSAPGTTVCNTVGYTTTCNQVGAVNIPGRLTTVDVNSGIRDQYLDLCMRQRGYQFLPARFCQTRDDTTTEDCVSP